MAGIGMPVLAQLTAAPASQANVATVSPSAATDIASQLQLAEYLTGKNQNANARAVLDSLTARKSQMASTEANQLDFLLGLLDLDDKNYEGAIHHFHRVLIDEPKAVRVRLELGRAYYLAKDYNDAEREFLYARAGKITPTVKKNIDRYLTSIRSLRTFSYSFVLSFAADSDMNTGPATDTVSLYGLPFQLSRQARANAGVGLAVGGGVEAAPNLAPHLKWRIGTVFQRSQYWRTEFDDMTLSGYTGPHLTFKRWDFNLLGNVGRRWYGDRVYTNMGGASLDATYYATTRLGIGGAVSLNHFDYPQNRLDNGRGSTVSANVFYTPSTASIVRAAVSLGRQDALDPTWANHAQQYSLNYTREFRGGITLGLAPTYTLIGYDAPMAAFGVTRVDHQFLGQVTLLDRKIDWHGLTPRLAYTYILNDSTIPLFTFHRNRVEIGITRAF